MANKVDKYQIFVDRGVLTQEEINLYKDSNLNAQQLQKIEAKIMQSDFESDAVEGFQEFPQALTSINAGKSKFLQKNGIKAGMSMKNIVILSIAAASFILIGSILVSKLNSNQPLYVVASKDDLKDPINEKTIIEETAIPFDDSISSDIQEMIPLSAEKIIPTSKIKEESFHILQEDVQDFGSIEIERMDIEDISQYMEIPQVLHFIRTKKMSTLFFSDLKVIDYSNTYKHPIDVLTFKFSGIPANQETHASETFSDGEVKHIPYLTYLESAMKLFAQEDFKGALSKYKTILKYYEDDENAYFYGGLCLYNLNKPDLAIDYFNKIQASGYFIFNQEALWLKAKCTYNLGKKEETIGLLKSIILHGGFYKTHAEKWIKEIK